MSDLPAPPAQRRYDEREVRRLLARAAELQATPTAARPATGLTLRELEEIAAEAGLDAAALRQAALELDAGAAGTAAGVGARLAGGPLKVVIEHTIAGALTADAIHDLLPLIQRTADLTGQASQVGGTVAWTSQSQSALRQFHASITVRGDSTHVYLEERYAGLAGALFGGGIGGVGGGLGGALGGGIGGALGSATLAVGLPVLAIGGAYAGARAFFRRYVAGRRRVLERLLQEIVARAPAAGT